ncbi:MAG: HemK2/MTQ2 family protein methyltransferase [Candidatus Thermoplasmatota archaeon]
MNWTGPDGHAYAIILDKDVYRPSDDTFLLAKAVHAHVRPGERFLEVGCGSGLVSLVAARAGANVTACDLNPHAVLAARRNATENRSHITVVESDLIAAVTGPFDVVAFNPPYLPTGPGEVLPGPLNLAFDGGPDGNATVLRFAEQVGRLRPLPRLILVVHSSLADPKPLEGALAGLGYACSVVAEESHFFERLTVRGFSHRGQIQRSAESRDAHIAD